MLDLRYIRENPDKIRKACADKHFQVDVDRLLQLDGQIGGQRREMEELQAERNRLSKTIGKAPAEEREALKKQVGALKPRLEELHQQIDQADSELQDLLLRVPAPQRDDVPLGKSDADNRELRQVGTIPEFPFEALDHIELGKRLGIIDVPRGVKLAGSRSYVLRGDGARLEQAVLQYTLNFLLDKGYELMSVPVLVDEAAMVGTGYFPGGRDQAYCVEKDGKALVGTSEVSMASYHGDEIIQFRDGQPMRFVANTTCFRREAGTYGKDTHGLYRVHQFQKIEQVILAPADEALSEKLHDELLSNAEAIMQNLGLPYRVVYVCSGDLGQGQIRKHDIEAWMPSRKSWGETHSCSTFHDFQARRLKIRYKNEQKKNTFVHTLNNTAFASPRGLIPLLEVHQQEDGSIAIPECLQPYMGGRQQIGP